MRKPICVCVGCNKVIWTYLEYGGSLDVSGFEFGYGENGTEFLDDYCVACWQYAQSKINLEIE